MDAAAQVTLVHEMVATAHEVFLEARNLNLKPPLQSNASLFTFSEMDISAISSSTSQQNGSLSPSSMLDLGDTTTIGEDGTISSTSALALRGDEIQDSFTKIAALKNLYIRQSTELLESIQSVCIGCCCESRD